MRPDDALSGGSLIVNCLCLVLKHESVIYHAALHQTAGNARRVGVNAVILKLQRGHGRAGVAQHKAELRGQAAGGHLLHRRAVQIGYHTTQAHILAPLGKSPG